MRLRKLRKEDAELMLEWMHDDSVVANLGTNFKEKKLEDCIKFIEMSGKEDKDLHMAIADDNDIYMGTVSLKHIDLLAKTAEFAITVRSLAMGKGYSKYAMAEILRKGTEQMGLRGIYWCVSRKNARAVRFYDKNGYNRVTDIPDGIKGNYTLGQLEDFLWYKY